MLLSGLTPFHRDKLEQITHRGYYKMSGKGWTDISDSAKDLVHKILKRKSSSRLNIEQILAHPWMIEATESAMDTDYKTRIKRLALRDKMQKFFRESKLSADNAERQQNLMKNVPLLNTVSSEKVEHTGQKPELKKQLSEFNGKLKHLKTLVVTKMSTDSNELVKNKDKDKEIDYESFVSMLNHCHLEELCTPAVFNIFDIGNTGTVDPKEFLMTMIAFRPIITQIAPSGDESDDSDTDAQLYFDMFDINDTGFIDMDELRLAVKFLLFMGSDEPQDLPNVEEMFNTIDLAKNGRIDFDEFKIFYKQLLTSQNSLALRIE
jgi:Ca2+-binding EF-hand superfamily protein